MLDTFRPGGLTFCCHTSCLFIRFLGFSQHEYWSSLPFPSLADHILSELFSLTCLGWPCTTRLIALLSYTSPFITTRLWPMEGLPPIYSSLSVGEICTQGRSITRLKAQRKSFCLYMGKKQFSKTGNSNHLYQPNIMEKHRCSATSVSKAWVESLHFHSHLVIIRL